MQWDYVIPVERDSTPKIDALVKITEPGKRTRTHFQPTTGTIPTLRDSPRQVVIFRGRRHLAIPHAGGGSERLASVGQQGAPNAHVVGTQRRTPKSWGSMRMWSGRGPFYGSTRVMAAFWNVGICGVSSFLGLSFLNMVTSQGVALGCHVRRLQRRIAVARCSWKSGRTFGHCAEGVWPEGRCPAGIKTSSPKNEGKRRRLTPILSWPNPSSRHRDATARYCPGYAPTTRPRPPSRTGGRGSAALPRGG